MIAVRKGINKLNPDWDYMFIRLRTPENMSYSYISPGHQGELFKDYEELVTMVVEYHETGDECRCDVS